MLTGSDKIKNNLIDIKNVYGLSYQRSLQTITDEIEDYCCTDTVIAIGASTGGIKALEVVLTKLPKNMPPILIVQHLPEQHTAIFAARLNEKCALTVVEAKHMEPLKSGTVYIAPGNRHMTLQKAGGGYYIHLDDGPKIMYHKPSVEKLFYSMAETVGKKGFGIILTGMGRDGAYGLKAMKDAGAYTIAQDQATSTVFGMPKQAILLGAADQTLPLFDISSNLIRALKSKRLPHHNILLSS